MVVDEPNESGDRTMVVTGGAGSDGQEFVAVA